MRIPKHTLALFESGGHRKGDVIAVARIAGIQAARRCANLISLCQPLMLAGINVDIEPDRPGCCVHILTACLHKGQ